MPNIYFLLTFVAMLLTKTNQFENTEFSSMNLSSWLSVAYLECLLSHFGIWVFGIFFSLVYICDW